MTGTSGRNAVRPRAAAGEDCRRCATLASGVGWRRILVGLDPTLSQGSQMRITYRDTDLVHASFYSTDLIELATFRCKIARNAGELNNIALQLRSGALLVSSRWKPGVVTGVRRSARGCGARGRAIGAGRARARQHGRTRAGGAGCRIEMERDQGRVVVAASVRSFGQALPAPAAKTSIREITCGWLSSSTERSFVSPSCF